MCVCRRRIGWVDFGAGRRGRGCGRQYTWPQWHGVVAGTCLYRHTWPCRVQSADFTGAQLPGCCTSLLMCHHWETRFATRRATPAPGCVPFCLYTPVHWLVLEPMFSIFPSVGMSMHQPAHMCVCASRQLCVLALVEAFLTSLPSPSNLYCVCHNDVLFQLVMNGFCVELMCYQTSYLYGRRRLGLDMKV